MKTFSLHFADETHSEDVADVTSFVARDASGSFGILAGRERFATALEWGLCAYVTADGMQHYVAASGGMLQFEDDVLTIATRRYLRDDDAFAIIGQLRDEATHELQSSRAMRELVRNLDRELLRSLLRE